jgi:hypothetical protein
MKDKRLRKLPNSLYRIVVLFSCWLLVILLNGCKEDTATRFTAISPRSIWRKLFQ